MYDCLAEVSVLILSAVLLFNTLSSFSFSEKKSVYFLVCVFSVMVSAFVNILSINCIEHFDSSRIVSSTIITSIYFLFIGLIQIFFAAYCFEFFALEKPYKNFFNVALFIPASVYFLVFLFNFKFNFIFRYDPVAGYVRGSLKNITYATTVLYAILILAAVFCNRKMLSKRIKIVFIIYPFLALGVSTIQFFSTYYVMTGTSSFATLLLVYLSIQSDLLEYDLQSGLLTERHLANVLKKKPSGFVGLISIENHTQLERAMSVSNFNKLIMMITSEIHSVFGRHAYHVSENKIAVHSQDLLFIRKNIDHIFSKFEQIKLEDNSVYHIDFIAATVEMPTHADNFDGAKELLQSLLSHVRSEKTQRVIYCQQSYVDEINRAKKISEILDRELYIDSKQFQVYFQPVYSVKENRFVYAEALARLNGTELGDILPSEFIPIAESKGMIERLGNIVFEKVCEFISKNKGKISAVSVNFSVYQMLNPNISTFVMESIKKYGIEPSCIIAEITESIFIEDFDLVRKNMLRISGQGVRFALDDFGTGYSNFANVLTLPFKTIKIDRSFVLMMEKKNEAEGFVKSLVRVFKDSGLHILVEGIETKEQDEMVRRTEIDFIQGFLYSRPVSAEDLLKCI